MPHSKRTATSTSSFVASLHDSRFGRSRKIRSYGASLHDVESSFFVWRSVRWTSRIVAATAFVFVFWIGLAALRSQEPEESARYGAPIKLADLSDDEIDESSGLAASRREADLFWTHNDSGDDPRLFAIDRGGRTRGTVAVRGAKALDWEDMASFEWNGRPHLMIADVGDNLAKRTDCALYVVREPAVEARAVRVVRRIDFRYEDGPHDCEAVGVDAASKTILLVAKVVGLRSRVYTLPLESKDAKEPLVARPIATIPVGLATAMDVSADGRRALIGTYLDGYEFTRGADEADWNAAFGRPARSIVLPQRAQGEAIAYGTDGRTIYLTSEKLPTPLWEIKSHDPESTTPSGEP